jgi:myosin heavy subunit
MTALEEQVIRTSRQVEETSRLFYAHVEKYDRGVEESRKRHESLEDQVKETARTLQAYGEKLDKGMEELRKRQECTEEQLTRTERILEEQISKVERALEASIEKSNRDMEKFREEMAEARRIDREDALEFRRRMDEMRRDEAEKMADFHLKMLAMSSDIGGIGSDLGDLTEIIVIPGVRPAMKKLGHKFDEVLPNKIVRSEKKQITEVDLLLTGGTEAMAVEIKARLSSTAIVDGHIARLEKLRRHEHEAGIEGKALYGALAGIVIKDVVEDYAKNNGLYIIDIDKHEYVLNVRAPEGAEVRAW